MKILPMLSAESIDLILTDPPYGISYKSKNQALHNQQVAGDKHPYIWWLHEAARILKEDGGLLCFTRWDVLGDWKAAIEWADLTVRSCIVWDKASHGMGNTKAQFAPQHEMCVFASKKGFAFPSGRPTDVQRVAKLPSTQMIHPTQKPIELMRRLITATTSEGDVVLDPFCGSGATCIAAAQERRQYIGIDIDAYYCRKARQQLKTQ